MPISPRHLFFIGTLVRSNIRSQRSICRYAPALIAMRILMNMGYTLSSDQRATLSGIFLTYRPGMFALLAENLRRFLDGVPL